MRYFLLLLLAFALQAATPVSIQDPETEKYLSIDSSGSTLVSDFYLEVAKGNVAGHSAVNKFGHNPAADSGEDIWGGGGTYSFYPETARVVEVLSIDADDDSGGAGAWMVVAYGLGQDYQEISETKALNGTTPVLLDSTYRRMFRTIILHAGASGTNEGNIIIRDTAEIDTAIFIGAGDGQTQHAIYTVPAGKTAYFIKGYVALQNANKNGEDGEFQYLVRVNNGTNGAWQVKGEVGLINIGTPYWIYKYGVPVGPIPEKSDIRIKLSDASTTMSTQAGFDLILVEDGY